jgi:DNA-binding response OmpR family regulator
MEGEPMNNSLLLVEDEESVAESVKAILDDWHIDWVPDGEAGLAYWMANIYSLVIVDLMLPGEIQGLKLINLMQQRVPQLAEFMIITGYPAADSLREALSMQVADYIIKPFSVVHLRHGVEMAKIRIQLREGQRGLAEVKKEIIVLEGRLNHLEKR